MQRLSPFFVEDVHNMTRMNREFGSELPCVGPVVSIANILNLRIGKFCIVVAFSMAVSAAVFLDAIPNIIHGRSKEKMVWVDATRIVTMVTDLDSFWDFSERNLEGYSMAHLGNSSALELAISICIKSAGPIPAALFVNPFPEPFLESSIELFNPGPVCLDADFLSGHGLMVNNIHGKSIS